MLIKNTPPHTPRMKMYPADLNDIYRMPECTKQPCCPFNIPTRRLGENVSQWFR